MKSIILIIPYFGILPNYFQFWLQTCSYNSNIDFLLFIDDKRNFIYPNNVSVIYTTFDKIKHLAQEIFEFPITLETPYKLCDYKCAYGDIFKEYIKDYDFWGHCDIDLFFGNIRKYITDDILDENERVLTRGHLSIYKNNPKVNSYYRTLETHKYQDWRDVYQRNDSRCFDEWGIHCGGGLSYICEENHIPMYNEIIFADLKCNKLDFVVNYTSDKNVYFDISSDGVFSKNSSGETVSEYCYVHFQKRNLQINTEKLESFQLYPPDIVANGYPGKYKILKEKCKFLLSVQLSNYRKLKRKFDLWKR